MIEIGSGSVQTWECDVMGHFNVQHYVARVTGSLPALGIALGIGPAWCRERGLQLRALEHHIRFLREQRPGAPFAILGGVVGIDGDRRLRLYVEMRHTGSGAAVAGFTIVAALLDMASGEARPLPAGLAPRAAALEAAVPAHAAPKGLRLDPPRRNAGWEAADRLGLPLVQQGAVTAAECDLSGLMLTRAYIGRIADAIPNLLARMGGEERGAEGRIGGAALEYRLVYRTVPRAGDVLALRSGVKALAGKATTWVHWLIDRESGSAVGTAEVVAVNLDLVERRAVELGEAARRALERRLVPELSA
jgi:acyl-CoA thioester hydrolase